MFCSFCRALCKETITKPPASVEDENKHTCRRRGEEADVSQWNNTRNSSIASPLCPSPCHVGCLVFSIHSDLMNRHNGDLDSRWDRETAKRKRQ
jgi:hypothetical protein